MTKKQQFEQPILTVDVVVFALLDERLHILLPNRTNAYEPFFGLPSLVGGYIHTQEDDDMHAAAERVLKSKIGIVPSYLEQLAMFSGINRDPRGWSATLAYISMVKNTDIDTKELYSVDFLPQTMGFDHKKIVFWAIQRLRSKSSYSTLPLFAMPAVFTLTELQKVYEAMMDCKMDKATFRYKIKELQIIESTGLMSDPKITNARPAELFRASDKTLWLFNHGMTPK